jgi:hypothetical protein
MKIVKLVLIASASSLLTVTLALLLLDLLPSPLNFLKPPQTSPTLSPQPTTPSLDDILETQSHSHQGDLSGQFLEHDLPFTDISISVDQQTIQTFTVDDLHQISQLVPRKYRLSKDQTMISIKDLLQHLDITQGQQVTLIGYLGTHQKQITFDWAEITDPDEFPILIKTFVPSYKLVTQSSGVIPVGNPSLLMLRIVNQISVDATTSGE